ncbi:hypothetical protein FPANT_6850 [Fusarium pseudoanthophilum]|uniref:Uncharacterized protein n=1 Tax=Fusarium pseudoanthophilum TaxID=48495 RepID=A0A8H5L6X5_9HYPO|nr:hypothetical protein FPANT_6850 [Fusarium pseudoanthophilum]
MAKPKPWLPQEPGPKLPPYDGNLMAPNVTFLKALDTDSAHGTIVKARIGRHLYAIKFIFTSHPLGIVVRDLKPEQYIDGTLIDLSLASTVPHPYSPTAEGPESPFQPRWTYESLAAYDLYNFQVHVIDFWKHNQKFWFSKRAQNGVQTKTTVDAYPANRCVGDGYEADV